MNRFQRKFINQRRIGKSLFFPKCCKITFSGNIKHIENGAWKNGFWNETFSFIGKIHTTNGKIYKIGFLSTIWGESCRATNRLFVFGNDNLCIGQYAGMMEPPIKITGSKLLFPFDEQYGNIIDFENGPPLQIWLNGENPEWMPEKKL